MKCPKCRRRLRIGDKVCLCGWAEAAEPISRPVSCCFVGCMEPALVRVETPTGLANVCITHYPQVEIRRRRVKSGIVAEIRKVYLRSRDFRRRNGLSDPATAPEEDHYPNKPESFREPGQDELEQELLDRAQP